MTTTHTSPDLNSDTSKKRNKRWLLVLASLVALGVIGHLTDDSDPTPSTPQQSVHKDSGSRSSSTGGDGSGDSDVPVLPAPHIDGQPYVWQPPYQNGGGIGLS